MLSTGAGGISGIGPLIARNLDGRGVRVIVIGEKGKGDAEFYSVRGMRKEPSWIKKWAPSLVKRQQPPRHRPNTREYAPYYSYRLQVRTMHPQLALS
jgi:hypothetical protein